jgi:elongation factor G
MGHSLSTTLAHMEWAGHWINLLDTPGLPDLLGRALLALPAVETAAVVVNANAGIEAVTRKVMEAATDKCRMIIVNRIDAEELDLAALMQSPTDAFGPECLPINLPAPGGAA